MRILLDTHILLWSLIDHGALSPRARSIIVDSANQIYVSPISLWEIGIKAQLGKLDGDANEICDAAMANGFLPLPFTFAHAVAVARLPSRHRDPFDRALIAQAQCEPLYLLTHDQALAAYGPVVMLV